MSDQDNQETAVINASSDELLKQAEEAKRREEQAAKEQKQAELRACREYGVALSEDERQRIDEFMEAQKDATRACDAADDAYSELESYYTGNAEEYNHQCAKYNDAVDALQRSRENIDDILEKLRDTIDKESHLNEIPDPLRQLLVNAHECGEGDYDFRHFECVEEYLDISSPDSDLCDAENLSVHLDDLCKLLPMEELLTPEDKTTIESWGNNMSVWQVYDSLKELSQDVKKSHLKYALDYYTEEGTGYYTMLKEMAHEFGIND
jgi:chromosome segregation ATPase